MTPWITFVLSTDFRKYHTRAQCATFSGPIQMIVVDGESHHVVLDTLSDR